MKKNNSNEFSISSLINKKGFTLIELIIVLAIFGIVISAIFSMNIFGIKSFVRGSNRYDLISETNLVSEYITKYIRYANGVEILSSSDTIPDSSDIASSSSQMDGYIFVSNVSGKDIVNYRNKDTTISLGEFDNCSLIFTPIELDKSLSFTITTSIKEVSFSVDSGIVPINLLIQGDSKIIDNTDIADGVALKISSDSSTSVPTGTLIFNPSNPPNGKVGTVYSGGYNLSASGGTSPYTYIVSDGSELPYGMILSSAGNLSGTPIEPGTFTVGIKVFDNSTPPKYATNFFEIIIENDVAVNSDAPIASNVIITGPESIALDRTSAKGSLLTASYNYFDTENEPESGSTFTWLRGTDSNGIGLTQITGATSNTYTPAEEDVNKYIYVIVTPHSTDSAEGYGTSVFCDFPVKIMSGGANSKPIASDVTIERSGSTLTGSYTYFDAEGDEEFGSIYKWYYSDNKDGNDKKEITTDINGRYFNVPSNTYKNKYIFFEVTPKASSGTYVGDTVISSNHKYHE